MTLFRQEVIEARRRRLWGEVRLSHPPSLTVWTVCLTTAALVFIGVLVLGSYLRKETVSGYLIPEAGIVQITAPRQARITRVLVQEGTHVKAGDPLLEFSGEISGLQTGDVLAAQLSETDNQMANLATRTRIAAEDLRERADTLKRQIASRAEEVRIFRKRRSDMLEITNISRKQLDRYLGLATQGFASQVQIDQLRQQILQQQGDVDELDRLVENGEANIADLRTQLKTLPDHMTELAAANATDLSVLRQKRIDLASSQTFVVRAPVAGIVTSLQAEAGQTPVVNMPLISMMPDGSALQAELLVPPRASGFIRPGQEVRLQLDAYSFQRFGFAEGRILSISKSVLTPSEFLAPVPVKEPVYRVRVLLDKNYVLAYGSKHPLQPGMSLIADIVIERRTLIQAMFDPLLSAEKRLH